MKQRDIKLEKRSNYTFHLINELVKTIVTNLVDSIAIKSHKPMLLLNAEQLAVLT